MMTEAGNIIVQEDKTVNQLRGIKKGRKMEDILNIDSKENGC